MEGAIYLPGRAFALLSRIAARKYSLPGEVFIIEDTGFSHVCMTMLHSFEELLNIDLLKHGLGSAPAALRVAVESAIPLCIFLLGNDTITQRETSSIEARSESVSASMIKHVSTALFNALQQLSEQPISFMDRPRGCAVVVRWASIHGPLLTDLCRVSPEGFSNPQELHDSNTLSVQYDVTKGGHLQGTRYLRVYNEDQVIHLVESICRAKHRDEIRASEFVRYFEFELHHLVQLEGTKPVKQRSGTYIDPCLTTNELSLGWRTFAVSKVCVVQLPPERKPYASYPSLMAGNSAVRDVLNFITSLQSERSHVLTPLFNSPFLLLLEDILCGNALVLTLLSVVSSDHAEHFADSINLHRTLNSIRQFPVSVVNTSVDGLILTRRSTLIKTRKCLQDARTEVRYLLMRARTTSGGLNNVVVKHHSTANSGTDCSQHMHALTVAQVLIQMKERFLKLAGVQAQQVHYARSLEFDKLRLARAVVSSRLQSLRFAHTVIHLCTRRRKSRVKREVTTHSDRSHPKHSHVGQWSNPIGDDAREVHKLRCWMQGSYEKRSSDSEASSTSNILCLRCPEGVVKWRDIFCLNIPECTQLQGCSDWHPHVSVDRAASRLPSEYATTDHVDHRKIVRTEPKSFVSRALNAQTRSAVFRPRKHCSMLAARQLLRLRSQCMNSLYTCSLPCNSDVCTHSRTN
mmetsp:Transcript_10250/g.41499  ORF Transcript_10250/g.41499 Transcript_10250/m.41499 type:complete len:688 (-) Transcript_10250:1331-3394(-)